MNRKGFALTETLVVVVFLVSIFTFIYVSIVPLLGKYENAINTEKDIDTVYKLYHIRKVIMSASNRGMLTSQDVKRITCSELSVADFCDKLMEQMELRENGTDNYIIVYAKEINNSNINLIKDISGEISEYANKYQRQITSRVLFLLDTKKHTVSHLYYDDIV